MPFKLPALLPPIRHWLGACYRVWLILIPRIVERGVELIGSLTSKIATIVVRTVLERQGKKRMLLYGFT
jgi:hypothetical protein